MLGVKLGMSRTWRVGLLWLLLSTGFSVLLGIMLQHASPVGMSDFKAVYYGARCLIQHSDPYNQEEFLRVYRAEGGQLPSDPIVARSFLRVVPVFVYPPTTLFLVAPFASLPWGPAHVLWMFLLAGSLILAAFLIWSFANKFAPDVAILLTCIVLANCELLFASGRSAGIVISLCIVAAWCFIQERFVIAGILCMAVSLALKPHDAGLVWLYFLLAGGVCRRRALQTLVVVAVLGLPAILWVSQVSPHWMAEIHSSLAATSARGGLGDPGPTSSSMSEHYRIIDLQTVISIFWDNPRIYNPVSYLICGALLLVWSIHTLRSHFSPTRAWFALAAIAALSMLPIYHRQYDAKLVLLTIPACAILWAEGGPIAWIALLVNTAGVLLTADIPLIALTHFFLSLHVDASGILGKILTVVLMRPAPLILLVMSIFYLWVYLWRVIPDTQNGAIEAIEAGK